MDNQRKSIEDIDTKVDMMYFNLNGRIKTVSTHVKILENQLAQIASKSRAPLGVLPVKSKENPREQVNVIKMGPWFASVETNQYRTATYRYMMCNKF